MGRVHCGLQPDSIEIGFLSWNLTQPKNSSLSSGWFYRVSRWTSFFIFYFLYDNVVLGLGIFSPMLFWVSVFCVFCRNRILSKFSFKRVGIHISCLERNLYIFLKCVDERETEREREIKTTWIHQLNRKKYIVHTISKERTKKKPEFIFLEWKIDGTYIILTSTIIENLLVSID